MDERFTARSLDSYFPDSKDKSKRLAVYGDTEGRYKLNILSVEDIEKIVEELRKKRPKWIYKRDLLIYEAWLKYYKAKDEGKVVNRCSEHPTPYVIKAIGSNSDLKHKR